MNVKTGSSPRWANADMTAVDLLVEWQERPGQSMPFTASPDDVTIYGRDIYNRAIAGEFGAIAAYVEASE